MVTLRGSRVLIAVIPVWLGLCLASSATFARDAVDEPISQFLRDQCLDCHSGDYAEAELDIESLLTNPIEDRLDDWVKMHDRVHAGEMPPDGMTRSERQPFTEGLFRRLVEVDRQRIEDSGRAVMRRMNRLEYENSLRQLLHAPWLQVRSILPEDGERHHFNKIGEALDVSHVNMARYMQAADTALREVIARHVEAPPTPTRRYYAREQSSFNRRVHYTVFNRSPSRATFPLIGYQADLKVLRDPDRPFTVGDADPETRESESFGVVASSYEPIIVRFNEFKAPEPGRYKLRIKGYTFWARGEDSQWWRPRRDKIERGRRPEPVLIYSHQPPRQLRRLGAVDLNVEPSVQELETWLLEGESIQPDAVRLFRSRPPGGWHNPLAERDGVPGVALNYLEVEGPIYEQWPPPGHQLLFGDLPLVRRDGRVTVRSDKPRKDAQRLLQRFLAKAYRRPAKPEELQRFVAVVDDALAKGHMFADAMIAGYTAVLCSPGFLWIEQQTPELHSTELATRLSLFLNNSAPDEKLLAVAERLTDPAVLAAEADRLLDSPKSEQFVHAFLDYWLDLRKINATSPNELLYPDYYLDDGLVDAAVQETRLFFAKLIDDNLPARNVIDSDFTFVNERLADHYGLDSIPGAKLHLVDLPDDSVRGGFITQASVLKVTANGTTTSPVVRGAWIGERLLGLEIPPPPKSVPAIEPDTRGATTIREQLAKHRADESCNACHQKIDPAGFALENFDIAGGYREFYRSLGSRGKRIEGFGKNGQPFRFRRGPDVDPSGQLPSGERFDDIREFKSALLQDERAIAKNLLEQLLLFATGAPPRFSDRVEIERILDRLAADHYPVRSMIHEIVQTRLFLHK